MVQLNPPASRPRTPHTIGRRIYQRLRTQIAEGVLPPGSAAPSSRALAAELGVSRTTVMAVYEQLAAEGFLVTSAGRVARIAAPLRITPPISPVPTTPRAPRLSAFGQRMACRPPPPVSPATPASIDFLYGAVASRDFPTLAWRRAYQAVLLAQQHKLYYQPPEGDPALRHALQGYLHRARGLRCQPDQILIVHGTQQAIDLCARLLLDADDTFVFEDPGYRIARDTFAATGAHLLTAPVDELGLMTDALPTDTRARLAYVTPSHQFPLGGVLPIARRQALLQWAQQHDAWIVEDDYDGEFRYGQHPIDALQSIDTEGRVIYIGTFSKALSPQLRLGYLVLPPALVAVFREAKRLTDRHAPVIEQRVLASLMDSGVYERHVRRMRRTHERRRTTLLEAIARYLPADVQVTGTAAGLHVVLWLPAFQAHDEARIVAAARAHGIGVYAVSPLYRAPADTTRPAGLTLGYGSLNREQITQGIEQLGVVLQCLPATNGHGGETESPPP